MKAVIGACKLIDGCSLALCSATVSVVSAGICHRNEVNSIAWLYQRAQPKIVSSTTTTTAIFSSVEESLGVCKINRWWWCWRMFLAYRCKQTWLDWPSVFDSQHLLNRCWRCRFTSTEIQITARQACRWNTGHEWSNVKDDFPAPVLPTGFLPGNSMTVHSCEILRHLVPPTGRHSLLEENLAWLWLTFLHHLSRHATIIIFAFILFNFKKLKFAWVLHKLSTHSSCKNWWARLLQVCKICSIAQKTHLHSEYPCHEGRPTLIQFQKHLAI